MNPGAMSSSSTPARPLTAHSTTLPGLPTELIIEIYKAADTFATAENLSKTSHHLHNIWEVHVDAILSSVVECYLQAKELAHVQADSLARRPPPSLRQQTITTAHCICMNVNLVSEVLYAFEYRIIDNSAQQGVQRTGLTPTERADFIRACYRAMTLAAKDRCCILHSIDESLDMLEYMQMTEAMRFLDTRFNPINASLIYDIEENASDRAREISLASRDLSFFHENLMWLDFGQGIIDSWYSAPFEYYFVLADGYQNEAGSARGTRLAELLPLLDARSGFYLHGIRCAETAFQSRHFPTDEGEFRSVNCAY